MTFDEARDPVDDNRLARAMRKGGNVILSNYLKRNFIPSQTSPEGFEYTSIINPIPVLEQETLATAPFLLPKSATTLKQFWTFKKDAGDIATFPVAIFQHYALQQAYPEIVQLIELSGQAQRYRLPEYYADINGRISIQAVIRTVQDWFEQHRQDIQELLENSQYPSEIKQMLYSWLVLAEKPNSLYFNFYGPAETITTVPFYQALAKNALDAGLFTNKIVLIGYSKTIEPEKSPSLYTVYSNADADFISPVEIAATAIANLKNHNWLQPISTLQQMLLIFAWGVLLAWVCQKFSFFWAICQYVLLAAAYFACAYRLFIDQSVWLPLFMPVFVQVPLAMVLVTVMYFLKGKQEHQKMHQAFSLYLPGEVVSSFAQNHDLNAINQIGELKYGVCLATDAGQYTTLSEAIDPHTLHAILNDYYAVMFPQVDRYNGFVSDVIGDAMLAIWQADQQNIEMRNRACHAALAIVQAVNGFNAAQPYQMPTRIGLHFGDIRLGNVGAAEHFEYRAVGDTVNTANRIEGLNKILGTQVLASEEVISGLNDFCYRELGMFLLKGKKKPVHIYELVGDIEQKNGGRALLGDFALAYKLFQRRNWSEALRIWQGILKNYPEDGPTQFYIRYLENNRINLAKAEQPEVIRIR